MSVEYDTREAVAILTADRARRHSQDFVEAREVAALALREAVLRSAKESGYQVTEDQGFHFIASQRGADVAVAVLASSIGIRVCKAHAGDLTDEQTADLDYDACAAMWIPKETRRAKIDETAAEKPPVGEPRQSRTERRSAVAVVAELVVSQLAKAEGIAADPGAATGKSAPAKG